MKSSKFQWIVLLAAIIISLQTNAQQYPSFAHARQWPVKLETEILFEIKFPFGRNSICEDEFNTLVLDSIVALFDRFPEMKIALLTHTDSRGDDRMNLELSQKRAEMIKTCLTERNIAPSRIIAQGAGESDPIHSDEDINQYKATDPERFETMHQRNRRTVLRVTDLHF